ncbi:conserved protein of unknown function [Micropruina glycogenica]|uniref:Uncharacterized protein n=1 Tax=Micropruina glycogenica TaxID=75385 RepID=A0A2N9JEY6_9ACTN|nr:conserved protein of unknown function [Micropruina glycogenica]
MLVTRYAYPVSGCDVSPLAIASQTSAWQGRSGVHQQARSRPRSSSFAAATSSGWSPSQAMKASTAAALASKVRRLGRNGLAHRVGAATLRAPSGRRQPACRPNWMRPGEDSSERRRCWQAQCRQGETRPATVSMQSPAVWLFLHGPQITRSTRSLT